MTLVVTDTSKHPPHPDIHGVNGVFLASVASLSLLSITSHHRDFHSHNSMSIHNSKVLTRHAPCPPQQRVLTFSHGTRVTVRDLFGSMPVRVKHRALQAERSSFTRDWDRLLLDVVALLIAWPNTVSVALRETSGRQGVTLKTNSQSRKRVDNGCQLLHHASLCDTPTSSEWVAVGASAPTLSVSGYVCREPVATKRVQFLSFGIEPLSNELRSNVLYEEINKVFADSSFGVIEDESDTNEPAETPKTDGFLNKDLKPKKKGVDRWPMFFLQITPTSVSQSCLKVHDVLDHHQPNLNLVTDLLKAMFYEFLKKNHCRPKAVILSTKPNTRLPKGQARSIPPALETSTASSVSSQHQERETSASLAPTTASAGPRDRSTSRHDTLDSRPASPFAAWSKVKSGQTIKNLKNPGVSDPQPSSLFANPAQDNHNGIQSLRATEQLRSVAVENSRPSLYDAIGRLTRKPFEDIDISSRRAIHNSSPRKSEDEERTTQPNEGLAQDSIMECINPFTQMTVCINSRTGMTISKKPLTLSRRASGDRNSRLESESVDHDMPSSNTQPWVNELVNKWKNPVFELTEEPIPKLPDVTELLTHDIKPAGHHDSCRQDFNMGTRFETTTLSLTGRVSKQTLGKAKLIAQVDRKFICAKLPLNHVKTEQEERADALMSSSALLLIDQHAADERCRVEELMAGYFKPIADSTGKLSWQADTEVLPRPVHFELSRQEEGILQRSRQYFAYWGITYDLESLAPATRSGAAGRVSGKHDSKVKLAVTRLPPAIMERCRTEPRLLAELIRKEAWRLNDEGGSLQRPRARPVSTGDVEGDVPVWVSLLHGCPQGILDLINSRSCRSEHPYSASLSRDSSVLIPKQL